MLSPFALLMDWLAQQIQDILPTLPAIWVYLIIPGILLLCGLGLPSPEDIWLIAGGYLAHRGVVNVHVMFLLCFASVLGGDALAFLMGKTFGHHFFQASFLPPLLHRTQTAAHPGVFSYLRQ